MNKLLHKGYYREMLRQLKVAGIISACILMVQQIGVFLSMLVLSGTMLTIPDAATMATAPMIYAYVMGLTLTFIAFNWLNSRANSDFYHSLPISRTSIYFSTIAAILTWLFIGIVGTGIVNALLYAVARLPFNMALYGMTLLFVLASAVVVVGAVSIACALCGTRFVDLAAAAVILFMPRVLLSIFGAFIYKCSDGELYMKSLCWLFDPSFNVAGTFPYAPILGFLRGGIDYNKFGALIYNFAYGILLTVLGWLAFKKRRSEDAGIPTTSKLFQTVVRCAFGMPLLLILAYIILDDQYEWLPIVLLVVFAFIFYCLYELISTKSPKKMCKAMPLFLVCIGVMLLYIVLPPVIARAELGIKIPAEDIKGYYVETDNDSTSYFGILESVFSDTNDSTYDRVMTRHIRFEDERSIGIIAEAYERVRHDNLGGYHMTHSYTEYDSGIDYTSIRVRIDRKTGRDIVRTVSIPSDKLAELVEIWNKNEEYRKVNCEFPEGQLWFRIDDIEDEDSRLIAEEFAKDFAKLTDEQRESISGYYYYGTPLAVIKLAGCRGLDNFNGVYSISELTPNAAALYIKLVNDKGFDRGMELLRKFAADEGDVYYNAELHIPTHRSEPDFDEYGEDKFFDNRWLNIDSSNCADVNNPAAALYRQVRNMLTNGERADSIENCVIVTVAEFGNYVRQSSSPMILKLSEADMQKLYELISRINEIEYGFMIDMEYPDGRLDPED